MGDGKIVRARVRSAPVTKQVDVEEINRLIAKTQLVEGDDKQTREMDPETFRALLRDHRAAETEAPPMPAPVVAEDGPAALPPTEQGAEQPDEPWLALAMSPPLEEARAPISIRLIACLAIAIAAAIAIVLLR